LSYWPVIVNDTDLIVYTINDGELFILSRDAAYAFCSAGSTC